MDTTITLEDLAQRLDRIERLLTAQPSTADDEELLSTKQVADLLGITTTAVYHLDLPKYKSGDGTARRSRTYFRRGDVVAYQKGRRVPSKRERQATLNLKALLY